MQAEENGAGLSVGQKMALVTTIETDQTETLLTYKKGVG